MKKVTVVCSALFALTVSAELWAQTRGPRYNPGGGSSSSGSRSSGSSSGSSSRGPSYNPSRGSSSSSSSSSRGPSYNPSRGSSSSSSSSSAPRGPRYNPGGSSSSSSSSSSTPRGPRYNPGSSSSGSSSSGSVSIPSTPRGPRYNPPSTVGTRYQPPRHQQVPGSVLVRRTVYHTPRTVPYTVIHFNTPRAYWSTVPSYYIYRRWIQYPVHYWYNDGYWDIEGYPYYVHRGYRYRYNPVEMCQYELVDGETYTTVKTYPLAACTVAYDQCSTERDTLNRTIGLERYFCAEAVDADLEAKPEDYRGAAIEITEAQRAAIASYLDNMSYKDIFHDGNSDGVGKCSIIKVGGLFGAGNAHGCKFQVNVGEKAFPLIDGSICSDDSSAEEVGCSVGNEKENAGCILQTAIQAGYCL